MNRKTALTFLALTLALALIPAQAWAAASCDLQFRIWTRDAGNVFYDYGQPIVVKSGVESHLFIHHDAQGPNPYSTSGEIGHLSTLGLGRHIDMPQHLTWKAQDSDDLAVARLELSPQQPGEVILGYRLTGVAKAGVFERLPADCRQGRLNIRVEGAKRRSASRPLSADGRDANRAAEDVVRVLYSSLLGQGDGSLDHAHVVQVTEQGHRGAVFVAMELVSSPAFVGHVYQSTAEKRPGDRRIERFGNTGGRVSGQQAIETSLQRLYGQLYGDAGAIQLDDHRQNIAEMYECLRAGAKQEDRQGACRRLGRALIKTRAFAEHHQELISQLPESYRGALD